MEQKIMIDETIAQRLVERFVGILDQNINIMDENGVIIASRDQKRVGSYHEIAHRIIREQLPIVEVESDEEYFGTKNGINMSVENRGRVVGVVGITGEPDKVRPLALMLKASIEVMLEHEIQQKELASRRTKKEELFNNLLYGTEQNADEIDSMATKLGYDPALVRVPILIVTGGAGAQKSVADICKGSAKHSKQDMLHMSSNGNTVIFLDLKRIKPLAVNTESASTTISPRPRGMLRPMASNADIIALQMASKECGYRRHGDVFL